ncbi:MAG: hypothetical protein HY711_04725 [Candidatus Melainabacteria bacterium]|nr:hypothetical protein [Candidatus Melainabacteria bacterium]
MLEDLGQHVRNEAAVVGQVLAQAPGAIWEEICNDWQHDRHNLLKREGCALGVGAGLGVLLSRSPVLGGVALAVPTFAYGLGMASAVTSVLGRAWDANTQASRQALVSETTSKLAREGATTLETMPALILGGGAGVWASRRVYALDRLAFGVTEAAEFPARSLIPERLSWVGPGTKKLSSTLLMADGSFDALKLSELLASQHPWQGVEVARAVRLSDMRVSRAMPGTPFSNQLGFPDAPGRVLFHTHPPVLATNGRSVLGARPSIGDLKETLDVGIIQSGEVTTIYQGAAREFVASHTAGTSFSPVMRAVTLDRQHQTALAWETRWDSSAGSYVPTLPTPLDYNQTLQVLSRWDRQWSSIQAITPDWGFFANPDIALLKLGVY